MQMPREVLISSLYSTLSPEACNARRAVLSGIPNPGKRAAGLALHELATRQPRLAAAMIGLTYQAPDLEHIGDGCESSVFRLNPGEVLKVNRSSIRMSPRRQAEFQIELERKHSYMTAALGEFAVPQTSSITIDPLFTGRTVVSSRQPFQEISDSGIAQQTTPEAMAQAIERSRVQCPDIGEQLAEFSERCRDLYDRSNLVADILGTGNLVLTEVGGDRALRMVDGQPLAADRSGFQLAALVRLDMLDTAVALVS